MKAQPPEVEAREEGPEAEEELRPLEAAEGVANKVQLPATEAEAACRLLHLQHQNPHRVGSTGAGAQRPLAVPVAGSRAQPLGAAGAPEAAFR